MKTCIKCNIDKNHSEFYKSNICTDGYRGACRACTNKSNKDRRSNVVRPRKIKGVLPLPELDRLRELFSYREGQLVRLKTQGSKAAGTVVSSDCNQIYNRCSVDGVHYLVHRIIYKLITGGEPHEVDHINQNKKDNRIENLRPVTREENMKNKPLRCDNKIGINGVYFKQGLWFVYANRNKQRISIGRFDNLLDAVAARMRAEIEFGYHKNHGKATTNL